MQELRAVADGTVGTIIVESLLGISGGGHGSRGIVESDLLPDGWR